MLELTKKRPIKRHANSITFHHAGKLYIFPVKIAKKYCVAESTKTIPAETVFAHLNSKYTKPGALLRGIRVRENLTQIELAKKIKVTQSDISQMEKGTRNIGRVIAKRIEKLFGVDYRSFLS